MQIEILQEKENLLLHRKEISFRIAHPKSPTPKRAEIREKIVAKFDAKKEASYIVKMKKPVGKSEITGVIHIYADPAVAKKIEPQHIIFRNDGKPKETPGSEE